MRTPLPVHSQHGLLLRKGPQDYRSRLVIRSIVVVTSTLAAPHVSNYRLVSPGGCLLPVAFRPGVPNSAADLATIRDLVGCLALPPQFMPLLSSRRRRGLGLLRLLR
jgi:hypothetical protein